MDKSRFEIKAYDEQYRRQIIEVWEKSVLATHHFLSQDDFDDIKELVRSIDFKTLQVYCLTDSAMIAGFIGVDAGKIEMLFLDPGYFGQGLGKALLTFAIGELGARELDVNEQNTKALEFYRRSGFVVFDRMDKDGQGKDYPLLKMRLEKSVPDAITGI